ncbi:MAG: hypothetical protein PVF59_01445 [Desulfobacterales bacterium]|jgi:hypothetical protein
MTRAHHRRACLLLAVLASMLLGSCTTFKSKVAAPPPREPVRPAASEQTYSNKSLPTAYYRNIHCYVHQVRWPEESLERVAQWYTGSGANWKILARSTPNLQLNRLRKGNVVFIPVDLLQIDTPMPRQYVQQRQPSKTPPAPRQQPSAPETAPEPVEDDTQPQPYGPRPFPKKTSP